MSNKSKMVVATKFQLLESVGGKFNKKGAKKEISTKLVAREYVEYRNSQSNNELYVIDEKETKKMVDLRKKSIAKQIADKEKAAVSNADVVDALVNKISSTKTTQK